MIINNKIDSINKINELNLNRFAEQLFKENEEDKIIKFLEENPARYYAIRDKSNIHGTFKLKVLKSKVLEEIKGYKLFTINVSSINYVKNNYLLVKL